MQKRELNPFIDQEIPANVREVSDFAEETPAKVVEIVDPYTNSNYKPSHNPIEHFECEPEIPIVLVDKGNQTVIMRSTPTVNDLQWERYKKVSEMKIKSAYGMEITLEQLLADAMQMKEITEPLRFRPVPIIVQGGLGVMNVKPVTSEHIKNNETQSQSNRSTCNPCEDEMVKTRPNFPVFSTKWWGF